MGLELLIARGVKNIEIIGNLQLVIKQMARKHLCISKNLTRCYSDAGRLLSQFDSIFLQHVSRDINEEANELAQIASKYKISPHVLDSLVRVEKIFIPIDEREVNFIDTLEPSNWRKPIVDYLRNPNESIKRKIRYRATGYAILGNTLVKKFVDDNLLTCLDESEAYVTSG